MSRLLFAIPALTLSLVALPITGASAMDSSVDATVATTALTKEDDEFITHATRGGLFEIKSSELAIKRGVMGADKDFAQKMIDDHTTVNDELATLAKKKGAVVPTDLGEKKQKKLDELGKEQDTDFAKAYVKCQVEAHKKAVDEFEEASKDAKDPDVRAFAAKHLPHLQAHLTEAKQLEKAK